jgi:replicative DNA helicase
MKADEARDEIKRRWRDLWKADKGKGKQAGIICPLCGSGSGEKGSGVKEDTRKDGHFLKCFACGFAGDAVSLLGAELRKKLPLRGSDFKDVIEEGAKRLSLSVEWQDKSTAAKKPKVKKQETVEAKPMPKVDYSKYLDTARKGLDDERVKAYIKGRGLSVDNAKSTGIGFDQAWIYPDKGKFPSARIIIPFAGGVGYMARAIEEIKDGKKLVVGSVGLFNVEALKQAESMTGGAACFVVEGWADALSVMEAGYPAIAINGAQNGGDLIKAASNYSGVFLIAMDNDTGGKKGIESLSALLEKDAIPFSVVDICGGYKDANEHLQADRDGFKYCCFEAFERGRAAAQKAASPDSLKEYITGGAWREDVKRSAANREKTGFPSLDDWLGGGLYEGLAVLSGFPSLGKTSFLWQIAENVAAAGCHALFFSLEMSRADMLAKSLSRRAYRHGRDITNDDAQSGRDDCKEELRELLADVGGRLEVVEGAFGYGVEAIRKRALVAKRASGGRLCVFIDYLQAAADYKVGSEITAISDTAKAFRQLARELHCPVVCASSTARTNYNSVVDYSCFYGSGGIEFAADVAAGLQLSVVYSPAYIDAGTGKGGKEKQASMVGEAIRENLRQVSLVGLKNRRGQMRRQINFLFDARHSVFSEDESRQESALSPSDVEGLLAI